MSNSSDYTKGREWIMTSDLNIKGNVYAIGYYGHVSYGVNSKNFYSVRPTFYLSKDIVITGGTGTETDPYILSVQ